ncbi:MAG: EamA family transporter, partial [Eggerthellaceae bacterium]|nr:EamA family transporter [Eggerthellaceae bacterium]
FLSAVCFALAGVLIKSIDWGALSISGGRSVFAAAVLYAYLRAQGKRLVVNRAVLIGAAVNFIMLQTFVIANKLTTAANAIVLQFTMPAWIIIILWVFFHEKPRRSAVAACIVIFIGIVCFFFDQLSPTGLLGNVIAVVSGIAYAGVFLIKRFPECDFESAAILSFVACAVCGIPSIVQETDFAPLTLAAVVVLGVVQVGLAYILLSKGLDSVSPVAASLISTIEPILNPLLVAAFVGETVGPLSLAGAVLVIASAAAYNVHAARH